MNRKKIALILAVVLFVVQGIAEPGDVDGANVLFSDDFSSGNLDKWTPRVRSGNRILGENCQSVAWACNLTVENGALKLVAIQGGNYSVDVIKDIFPTQNYAKYVFSFDWKATVKETPHGVSHVEAKFYNSADQLIGHMAAENSGRPKGPNHGQHLAPGLFGGVFKAHESFDWERVTLDTSKDIPGLNIADVHRIHLRAEVYNNASRGGDLYVDNLSLVGELGGGTDDHGNTRAEATVLPQGNSLAGRIEPSNDIDYFRVVVNNPGQLTVYTTGNFDTLGSLRTDLGSLLIDNDNGGDHLNFRIQRQVRAGTYYVRVEGHGNAIGNYTVHATFSSDGDDHGNTSALATPLSLGSSLAGRIERSDDVDYFRVTVLRPGELTLYTTGNLDTRGWLEVGGRTVANDDDNGDNLNFRIQRRTGTGTHYIKVGSLGGVGNYTIHARFTPEGGADDHGNTRDEASLIQNVGDSIAGRIEPGDDVDYFRVRVNAPGQLTVYTTGNIDTIGWLEDISGKTPGSERR